MGLHDAFVHDEVEASRIRRRDDARPGAGFANNNLAVLLLGDRFDLGMVDFLNGFIQQLGTEPD